MRLQFLKPYPNSSITKKFDELEINDFSIITGKNGTGKTHLLEAIVHNDNYINIDGGVNTIYFNYNDFTINNSQANQQSNKPSLKKKNGDSTKINQDLNNIRNKMQQEIFSPLYNSFKENNRLAQEIYQHFISKVTFLDLPAWEESRAELLTISSEEETIKEIYIKLKKLIDTFLENKDESYYKYFKKANSLDLPFHNLTHNHFQYQENWLGQLLEKEFKEYIKKYDKAKKEIESKNSDELTLAKIKKMTVDAVGIAPWNLLNEILKSYNCNGYLIDEDLVNKIESFINIDQQPLNIQLKNCESNTVISLDRLSSGEKTLFALAVSLYRQEKDENLPTVLLLDEIDSSLHPSMCKQLLDVLENVFVKKYGLKIIMVTHSPSTVALAPDESVYIMENDNGKVILENKNKQEAISFLSDGFATMNEGKILFENILNSKNDLILFTEGETDIEHINIAKEKLGVNDLNFDIHSCDCALKLKQFLMGIPKGLGKDKKIVGIFDYDEEGLREVKGLNGVIEDKNIYQRKDVDNIYSITLPCPNDYFKELENCTIEFLYKKDKIPSDMLEKIHLKKVNDKLKDEQIGTTEYEIKDDLHFCKLSKNARKGDFSKDIKNFDKDDFIYFEALFNRLKYLNERK